MLTENSPAIELTDVQVRVGTDAILDMPEFRVESGEQVGIIGPNGAGKSTLLRVVAMLQKPSRGTLNVLGERVWPQQPPLELRRKISVVFQKPHLLDMTVEQNVAVGLRVRGIPRPSIAARSQHWLRQFGVWHLRDRGIYGLSGGEAQRVSLARAFALEPRLMLLDEPFANLDLPTRQQLLVEVQQALAETNATMILVSHDFYEVDRLCTRVVAMFDGQPVAVGAPQTLLEKGGHSSVDEFLEPWKELSAWSKDHNFRSVIQTTGWNINR